MKKKFACLVVQVHKSTTLGKAFCADCCSNEHDVRNDERYQNGGVRTGFSFSNQQCGDKNLAAFSFSKSISLDRDFRASYGSEDHVGKDDDSRLNGGVERGFPFSFSTKEKSISLDCDFRASYGSEDHVGKDDDSCLNGGVERGFPFSKGLYYWDVVHWGVYC